MALDPQREELYAALRAKLAGADPLLGERKEIGDEERRNSLYAALQQSANQMGSLGGRVVKDTAVAPLVAGLAQSNASGLKDRATALEGKDRVRQYLLSQMDQSDEVKRRQEERAAEREQRLAFHQEELGQRSANAAAERAQRERLAGAENASRLELEKLRAQNELESLAQKTKTTPAAQKSDQEASYRFISLKNNAEQLKDLIKKEGTASFTGPAAAQMDSKIYQMAVDFAKLVDPDSVAREGEVAAAQKYMLPFREYGGLTTRNNTAISQIDNYMKDLDSRLAARQASKTGDTDAVTYQKEAPRPESGTAYAAPAAGALPSSGAEEEGFVFMGGDPSKEENWRKK